MCFNGCADAMIYRQVKLLNFKGFVLGSTYAYISILLKPATLITRKTYHLAAESLCHLYCGTYVF